MKKVILSILFAAVLVLALAVPAFATAPPPPTPHSQIWYLYDATMANKWGNTNLYMSTTGTPVNSVNVLAGTSKMWVADKIAQANVTFPNDNWVIRFGTDKDWGKTSSIANFQVDIGYWGKNPAYPSGPMFIFTTLAMSKSPVWFNNHYEAEFQAVPPGGQVVPKNTYLAVVVHNNSGADHPIYTGFKIYKQDGSWSYYYSCVTSPQSDPGYPLPELATGILLAPAYWAWVDS